MWDERTSPFDARIDAVARRMTDATPHVDLRARVLDRIAAGHRPRSIRAAWKFSLAAAAVAAVVIAVVLRVGHPSTSHPPITSVDRSAPENHETMVNAPAHAASAASRRSRAARGRVEASKPSDADSIVSLQLEPLAMQPMQMPGIDTSHSPPPEAIGLTRLTVMPLSSEGEK